MTLLRGAGESVLSLRTGTAHVSPSGTGYAVFDGFNTVGTFTEKGIIKASYQLAEANGNQILLPGPGVGMVYTPGHGTPERRFSPDGHAFVRPIESMSIFNFQTGQLLSNHRPHEPTSLTTSADGKWLFTTSFKKDDLVVTDVRTAKVVHSENIGINTGVIASPVNNRVAVFGKPPAIYRWDGSRFAFEMTLGPPGSMPVAHPNFTHDVSEPFSQTRKALDLHFAAIDLVRADASASSFSPNGKLFSKAMTETNQEKEFTGASTLEIWSIEKKQIVNKLRWTLGTVNVSAISNDGRFVALSVGDPSVTGFLGRAYLVDLRNKERFILQTSPIHSVDSLVFSPDGQRLLGTDTSGAVLSWDIEFQK